jgi:hypothetical protein
MGLSRIKTWVVDEQLSADDLNGEIDNILDHPMSLISPLTGNIDAAGFAITNLANSLPGYVVVTDPIYGADPTGVTDSTAAIQAAITAAGQTPVWFPFGVYKISNILTLPPITNSDLVSAGYTLLGNNSRINCTGGIANAFKITTAAYPTSQRFATIQDFVFDGTVTGAFVKSETSANFVNTFRNLRAVPGASATTLVQFENQAGGLGTPGGLTLEDIHAGSILVPVTIDFQVAGGGGTDFDDVHILRASNAGTAVNSAVVNLGANAHVIHSDISNLIKGGSGHGIYAAGGGSLIDKSRIARIYLEPTADATHYGVYGTVSNSIVENVWGFMADHTVTTAMYAVWIAGSNTKITNVGLYSTSAAGPPYASGYYPAIRFDTGTNFLIDFPPEYVANGTAINAAVTGIRWLRSPVAFQQNASGSLQDYKVRDGLVDNYGQGSANTITLPAASAGQRFRFTATTAGFGAVNIKPAAGEVIILNGTTLVADHKATLATPVVGDALFCYSFRSGASTYEWNCRAEGGTWTDGGV